MEAAIHKLTQHYFPGSATAVANRLIAEYITSQHVSTPEQNRLAMVQVMMYDISFKRNTQLAAAQSILHLYKIIKKKQKTKDQDT